MARTQNIKSQDFFFNFINGKTHYFILVATVLMVAIMEVRVNAIVFQYDGKGTEEPFNMSTIPANTTEITVKNTPLIRLVSGSFSNFTNCKTLTLKNTSISTVELGAFDGLSELVTLNLDHNNIQTVQPNLFEDLKNLETLSLRNNDLNTLNSDSFKGLVSLQLLDLHWHVLETLEADWFDDLVSLTNLRLDGIDTREILKVKDLASNCSDVFWGAPKIMD